ncbi:PBP1A family penicillin-binding protein [Parashewanella curva]|uniref:Penicillin-binding protein 1A n=1 Tax=Parashewanella curva TaxID=2338552 RepID=A0A3L8PXK7_9GAMM|nr:PBP1A family penicillin-binding protein [Parashewanella curva]RLV59363.1 PBP1A family penicillin-binding protein [Parashewanella curva]
MKWIKRLGILFISSIILAIAGIGGAYWYVSPELPDVATLKTVQLQTPLRIYSKDGKLISQFGEKRRIPLKLEDIPKPMIDAFLATEDARFYDHGGIDPIGVVRAAFVMLSTGQKKQGASTITMQVARNFFLTRDKTIIRKVKEIFISYHIEQLLTKDEILELYLNRIYLGQRAYGVGAAAQVYYGKDVGELTLPEIAVIAGLPKAPSTLNPITSERRAMARRNIVLLRMRDVNAITQAQYDEAIHAPNTASYHGAEIDLYAPYISEMARNYMVDKYGREQAYTGGYKVYTTVSSKLQLEAQSALRNNVFAYDERHGYRGPIATLWQPTALPSEIPSHDALVSTLKKTAPVVSLHPAVVLQVEEKQATVLALDGNPITLNWDGLKWARSYISDSKQGPAPKTAYEVLHAGQQIWIRQHNEQWQLSQVPKVSSAMVSLNPHDGAIEALVGGFSFGKSQYNRVTQAQRQLGSNIKPFIYTAALEKGYTLATLINNAPINEPDIRQGIAWRPKNSPDVYGGPTRIRVGLAKSINVMAVRALRMAGLTATRNRLMDFGFTPDELPKNESIALGSPAVTPMQVVRAFSVFANGGYLVEPYFINEIKDSDNNVVQQAHPTLACTPVEQNDSDDKWEATLAALSAEQGIEYQPEQNDNDQCNPTTPHRYAKQVISQQTAFLIRQALNSTIFGGGNWSKGNGWNGTAWRAARTVKRRDIAGKTGTTNESKDTWFSGFNPKLVTTVWVGFDDHSRELGRTAWNANAGQGQIAGAESGAKTAGPAWNAFMRDALKGTPEVADTPPEGIISVRIDLKTGKLTHKTDYTTRFEYFIKGTEPTEYVNGNNDDENIFIDSNSGESLFQ